MRLKLKTGIGYLILSQGTSLLAGIVTPIATILNKIFHVEASTTGMGQVAFEADWASSIALIMVVGFIVNLLLARFTKFKYVYLTAHQTYFIALVLSGADGGGALQSRAKRWWSSGRPSAGRVLHAEPGPCAAPSCAR